MSVYMHIDWIYFCIFFGAMLLISFIMSLQSANLYTMHVVIRKFSIIDLQFPASAQELVIFIKGIFLLPVELSKKSLSALKGQLYFDFLFIPAVYGSVFILCMKVSIKMIFFRACFICSFSVAAMCFFVVWYFTEYLFIKKIQP